MNNSSPFFSVLIPSYNRPAYLVECIQSVLSNEGEDFEIIISDDASPLAKNIAEAVKPFLERSNIRFYQRPCNLGEPANRNFLVSQAQGQYNITLSDDDTLYPHALSTVRRWINRSPDHDMYLFGYRVVDVYGKKRYDRVSPTPFAISMDKPALVRRMFEALWLPFLVCHPATFCCRQGVESEILYRQDVYTADDYMFLLECLNKEKQMYVIPECLMNYRWVEATKVNTQKNQSADDLTVTKAYAKVYYALQNRTDMHPSISAFIHEIRYRQRFLYDLMIRRATANIDAASLDLQSAHRQEFFEYGARPRRYMVLIKAPLMVAYELMQHFGIQGLLYSIRVSLAYLRCKVRRMSTVSLG